MKKFIRVLCCIFIVLSGLISCGKTEEPVVKNDTKPTETNSEPKNVEMEETQNYIFENGILAMAVPKGWQTDVDTYKEYRSYYSSDTSP